LQEFLAGTDPRNPASVFKFTDIEVKTALVRLEFPVVAGKSYTVQFRDEAQGSAWFHLRDIPPWPTNGTAAVLDSSATNALRFYRLVTPALP
jgi:hypothetical protein